MKKDKKEAFIIVRVTKAEKKDIEKKAGKSISEYIRKKLGLQ